MRTWCELQKKRPRAGGGVDGTYEGKQSKTNCKKTGSKKAIYEGITEARHPSKEEEEAKGEATKKQDYKIYKLIGWLVLLD